VFVLAGGTTFLVHIAVQDVEHLQAFLLDRFVNAEKSPDSALSDLPTHHQQVVAALPDEPVTPKLSRVGRDRGQESPGATAMMCN